ncbi:MAG: DUF3795 domain-containing protein [Bacteroidota bacterium]
MKQHSTIGCCGIDCGLCPRFYTKGDSACPGCGGKDFKLKHPSCGFHSCCAIKKELEVCSECIEYPCKRFDAEKEGYDSFVSHQKVFVNLDFIKQNGINDFILQQKQQINILNNFLNHYDDGRSKSFFCICCTLLPLDVLQETQKFAKKLKEESNLKEKNKQLRNKLQRTAEELKIELKLKNK